MNFKHSVAVIGILGMILPSLSLAATSTPPFGGQNLCSRLGNYISKMETRVTDREQNILSRRGERQNKWSDRLSSWDEKREAQRNRAESRMTDLFLKLEPGAITDAQKQAVMDFKTAIQVAIGVRKTAVDAAILAFRTGVETQLSQRKIQTENAVLAYKNAQKAAFDKAKSSCDSVIVPGTVLETLKTDLKTARDNFQAARTAIEKAADKIKALNETKKAAMEKAHQDFKAALEKAKADFKAVFLTPTITPALTPTP